MKIVNQAIGRVIRHKNDYGAIILVDERYTELRYKRLISKWLRDNFQKRIENHDFFNSVKLFFEKMKSKNLPKKDNLISSNKNVGQNINQIEINPPRSEFSLSFNLNEFLNKKGMVKNNNL